MFVSIAWPLRKRRPRNRLEVKKRVSLQAEVAVCCTARVIDLVEACRDASVSTKRYENIFVRASEGKVFRGIG